MIGCFLHDQLYSILEITYNINKILQPFDGILAMIVNV